MPFTKGHTVNVGRKHSAISKKHYSIAKKGRKLSEETKKLISLNSARWNKGKHLSEETKKKLSKSHLGKVVSVETRLKMSASKSGIKLSEEHRLKVIKTLNFGLDEAHPLWKGNNVGYNGLHQWVGRKLGKPKRCEFCGTTDKKRYDWANISRQYKRDLNDWVRLCASCHKRYDMEYKTKLRYNSNSKV